MLYITRSRYKERVEAGQLAEINQLIDGEILPAIQRVEGVRSAQAYNSITGELTIVLDLENLATVERILGDSSVQAVLGKVLKYLVRVGGEVLYDRPLWQSAYGRG